MSAAYWFLYLRDTDEVGPSDAEPEQARSGNGRVTTGEPMTRS